MAIDKLRYKINGFIYAVFPCPSIQYKKDKSLHTAPAIIPSIHPYMSGISHSLILSISSEQKCEPRALKSLIKYFAARGPKNRLR
jgi:hypothetical protein